MKQGICRLLSLGCLALSTLALSPAAAQVTSDGTTNTNVDANGNDFTINQGDRAGGNLFHSFRDFSVPNGGSAFFDNAADIVNIFSRVTGGNISNIDGLIRANGSANLFLINPRGIVFGSGARLDIGGSFYGSSADSILFDDGEFSATDLENPPLLTVNAPIGLSFRDNPGDIVNRSNFGLRETPLAQTPLGEQLGQESTIRESTGLQVDSGETIALIGGDVIFNNAGAITAPGGRVELGGLSSAGEITFNSDGSLNYPEGVARGDVTLTEQSRVNVTSGGSGFINVNAGNLTLSEKSQLLAGISENSGSPTAQAGDITINATDAVKILGSNDEIGLDTEINNHVGLTPLKRDNPDDKSNAQGNAGVIRINTNLLEINNEGKITSINFSAGNSGEVFIDANNILIERGAIASAVIDAKGNVGNITINATDAVIFDNGIDQAESLIISQVIGDGEGDAGNITINTGSLLLREKSFILADNQNKGNAGNITINATKSVVLDGTDRVSSDGSAFFNLIISQVQNDVVGNGGDISISSPLISLANFSLISTNAKQGSIGQAGNITLNADTINLTNGSIIDALTENDFDGGDININANFLELSNGGKIVTGNDRGGSAGNIELNIAGDIILRNGNPPDNSPFFEQVLQSLIFETGIFASNFPGSIGNGGNIFIAADSIKFEDRGSILAETVSGEGGNITLETQDLISLRNDSLISSEAIGMIGDGGNINIDTSFIIAFPNGNNDIIASAERGQGGNINITAEALFGIEERPLNDRTNDINASSQFGLDGTISIFTTDVDAIQRDADLPSNPIESEQTVAEACRNDLIASLEEDDSTIRPSGLVVKGKGGIPHQPIEPFNADAILVDGKISSPSPQSQHPEIKPIKTSIGDIYPARGVIVKENGDVILT
ncbi:MAG: filamentous hemagglutinin N-terminal domain-containing protein, partial [Pleurocapsa sp.]